MIGPTERRSVRWIVNLLVLLMVAGIGFYVRGTRIEARNDLVASSMRSDARLCKQLNGLRRVLREDENEQYARLGVTLKILRIEPTPQVLRVARRRHNRTLDRLHRHPC